MNRPDKNQVGVVYRRQLDANFTFSNFVLSDHLPVTLYLGGNHGKMVEFDVTLSIVQQVSIMASLSIRIDLAPDQRIGPGKIKLLENVAALGSIAAGGRALGMSYRHAWLLID